MHLHATPSQAFGPSTAKLLGCRVQQAGDDPTASICAIALASSGERGTATPDSKPPALLRCAVSLQPRRQQHQGHTDQEVVVL